MGDYNGVAGCCRVVESRCRVAARVLPGVAGLPGTWTHILTAHPLLREAALFELALELKLGTQTGYILGNIRRRGPVLTSTCNLMRSHHDGI